MPTVIRSASATDMSAVTEVYGWNVLNGTGTFELEPPSLTDMQQRLADVTHKGLPWLVIEHEGAVQGYAYANLFRPRLAYRHCLEDSIYLAPTAQGRGWGRLLLLELMARAQRWGARQMIAVIGDSANQASVGLHRSCGFEPAGVLSAAGWKFDAWRDVVLMQRSLGQGDQTPPLPSEGVW